MASAMVVTPAVVSVNIAGAISMERPLEIAFRAGSFKSMKNLAWASVVMELCHRERETDPRVRRFQCGYYGRDSPLQPGDRSGKS